MPTRTAPLCLALAATLIAVAGCRDEPAAESQMASAPASPATDGAPPPVSPDAELPPGHPPIDFQAGGAALPSGHTRPADAGQGGATAGGGASAGELAWQVPDGWVPEPPANNMRRAQYRVPGPGGEGECVVFYFGAGQGGDAQANAARWAAQFTGADGAPATGTMKTRTGNVGGMEVLYVEARGAYDPGMMAGGTGGPKPGYALLGAVVAGPESNWFFKLTGPERTVEAQRAAFEAMLGSTSRS